MNSVNIMGRLGRDPEIRYAGETPVANFSIGVQRDKENTDWINITAWAKDAEIAEKYLKKGMLVGISGRIQTNMWKDKDGKNRTDVYVRANRIDFAENKSSSPKNEPKAEAAVDGFMSIGDGIPEELPFD